MENANPVIDYRQMLKGAEAMNIMADPKMNEMRLALRNLIIAGINFEFDDGRVSAAEYKKVTQRVDEITPVVNNPFQKRDISDQPQH